jgi:serine kinase of HPr protein (carbohydrate metabolism regulator)
MLLKEICDHLNLKVVAGKNLLDRTVSGGYASDLLSWVMAHAKTGNIWITIQNHQNIVAVASLLGLSAVVIGEGVEIAPAIIEKAEKENLVLLSSPMPIYEICGKLHKLGVTGRSPN